MTTGEKKGIYNHRIIQKAVNTIWFKNKRDEGVVYTDLFNPLPVQAIALVLTGVGLSSHIFVSSDLTSLQIECNIDEWITGIKTDVTFWADEYRSVYLDHVKSLTAFGEHTKKHDLLGRLQRKLHNYGRYVFTTLLGLSY